MANNALQKLDNETRSKIRSTQIITSLPQIISELVQNSLDAGTKSIDVGIAMDEWSCWVKDDGHGINKSGLQHITEGCERGRYATSKAYNLSSLDYVTTFGFRGEALASIGDLCTLEISSRTSRSRESWSVIVKGSKTLYCGPSTRWRKERPGTTVAVRDAFYNLPVRRLSHPNASRTVEMVRREIEALSLVFPSVSFSLEDNARDKRDSLAQNRVLNIPKTHTTLKAFRHLYGRTLVEHVEETCEERDSMKIEGFLSLVGSLSKAYQFLFLNRHLLDVCDLHRVIEQKFSSSSFAKNALDETGEVSLPRSSARRSPRKAERKPIFVLNITVPPCQIDNCLEPAKSAVHLQDQEAIVSFLADVVESFLVRHGFRDKSEVSLSKYSGKKRKRRVDDDASVPMDPSSKNAVPTRIFQEKEIYVPDDPSLHSESQTTWTDPNNGRAYIIDQRTGNSYLKTQSMQDGSASSTSVHMRRTLVVDQQPHRPRDRCMNLLAGESMSVIPEWMKKAFEENGTFAPTEREIGKISHYASCGEQDFQNTEFGPLRKQSNESIVAQQPKLGGLITAPISAFSKECISSARVLGQVDRKFIACLMDFRSNSDTSTCGESILSSTSRTLVLVDQHAADERIRVERFLKELCLGFIDSTGDGVEKRILNPPVPVLLSSSELDKFRNSIGTKLAFQRWGFTANDEEGSSGLEQSYAVLNFSSVPEIVADKLLSDDNLSEFIKTFLARLDSEEKRVKYLEEISSAPETDFGWLKALRLCPRELIELVNSKACRGAIMFNDQLTIEQCKRLMRQLSMTAYPFQCAHGRPSIVPLTTLPAEANAGMTRPVDWSQLKGAE